MKQVKLFLDSLLAEDNKKHSATFLSGLIRPVARQGQSLKCSRVRLKCTESRGWHIPTQRMVSPTHVSAAGVSLEVNAEVVRLSSEEFRGIGWSLFLMSLRVKSLTWLSVQDVCTEAHFYAGGCGHHGNLEHELTRSLKSADVPVVWCRRMKSLKESGRTESHR